jgi:hypothetical protein
MTSDVLRIGNLGLMDSMSVALPLLLGLRCCQYVTPVACPCFCFITLRGASTLCYIILCIVRLGLIFRNHGIVFRFLRACADAGGKGAVV